MCLSFIFFFFIQSGGRTTSSSSIPQLGADSYSDMRRELDSRFLNSTPGLGTLLPPQLGGASSASSSLYRPVIPTMGLPGLGPAYPAHSTGYPATSTSVHVAPSASSMLGNLGGMGLSSAPPPQSLPTKLVLVIYVTFICLLQYLIDLCP